MHRAELRRHLLACPSVELSMRFNHPVSHLVVAGQLQSHINDHRYGDYDGPSNMFTISKKYPEGQRSHWLKSMQVHFNNSARMLEMPWWFFHETMAPRPYAPVFVLEYPSIHTSASAHQALGPGTCVRCLRCVARPRHAGPLRLLRPRHH